MDLYALIINLNDIDYIKNKSFQDYIIGWYNGNGSLTSFQNDINNNTHEIRNVDDFYEKNDIIKKEKIFK